MNNCTNRNPSPPCTNDKKPKVNKWGNTCCYKNKTKKIKCSKRNPEPPCKNGYYSKKSEKEIIPWHVDQAYQGDEKKSKNFVNPDHYFLKFFIYLTDVKSENGCTSYIPKSHKIAYALRKGIFKNKIEYQPYWSLQDFRKIISKKENITFLKNYLNDSNLIDDFLEKTKFIEENEEVHNFDFELPAGGAIIFDEGGVHKGSKTNTSDRIALRYLYSVKKYNY